MFDAKRGYNHLTTQEKWFHHAYIYGMRRVLLNSREEKSPVDPDGTWYNSELADEAEEYYRQQYRAPLKPGPEPARYREAAEWRENAAKERGYESFEQAMAAGLRRAGLAGDAPRSLKQGGEE